MTRVVRICISVPLAELRTIDALADAAKVSRSKLLRAAAALVVAGHPGGDR